MTRKMLIPCLFLFAALAVAAPVHAGVFENARNWLSAEAAALAASLVAAILSGITGYFYTKAVRTFKEAGEFLTTLSLALEDKRITREELAQIIREGRDMFRAWE